MNWTIEWIQDDGSKIFSKCSDKTSIATAFSRTSFSKELSKSYAATDDCPLQHKKRKLCPPVSRSTLAQEMLDSPNSIEDGEVPDSRSTRSSQTLSPEPTTTEPNSSGVKPTKEGEKGAEEEKEEKQHDDSVSHEDDKTSNIPYNIYLHHPRARSRIPVLIPISPPATIADILRGHTVLEFPTFYVLPWSPADLPADKYLLEVDYLQQQQQGNADNGETNDSVDSSDEEGQIFDEHANGLDQNKVLDVLRMDLGG